MASSRPVPLLLRTARTASSSTTALCPSCYRPSLVARWTPIRSSTPRRTFADDEPKRPASSALRQLIKEFSPNTNASTVVPRSSGGIFTSMSRTPGTPHLPLEGRSAPSAPSASAAAFAASQVQRTRASSGPAAGATILDPYMQFYFLNVYSTKHNTHITFSDARRNVIATGSTGILGFRKAARHTYDAAYQLASHIFQKIQDKGVVPKKVEVVLRGFGVGREAVTKALLGKEGRYIKDVVMRVTDGTRTKFGGHRSKNRRRL
ncbi:37S ribosomal protein S18 [Drechslerella dactyloides]|uniref:37S ribosomal protein S18 n=1 Tax=Drechslerella dactyloides TaxID=74499 RepID=A0AAD6NGR9_DREDA|nr:37S ribosomal protein S18 [Drechslerella dactyloides]